MSAGGSTGSRARRKAESSIRGIMRCMMGSCAVSSVGLELASIRNTRLLVVTIKS